MRSTVYEAIQLRIYLCQFGILSKDFFFRLNEQPIKKNDNENPDQQGDHKAQNKVEVLLVWRKPGGLENAC